MDHQHPNSEPDNSPAGPQPINSPLKALQTIILKPNQVFSRLKGTPNWSWLPFIVVIVMSALPQWLYFNTVDMEWYADKIIAMEYAGVSPSEQAQARHIMLQQDMGSFTTFAVVFSVLLTYAIFALYLHKVTRIDEENILSFGDWYGFMWWATLPFAFFSAISVLIILFLGGPQLSPEYLGLFSVAGLLGIPMESDWYGWAQGIGLDTLWVGYLIAVGVSRWTRLSTRQSYTIAAAPFVGIWGVWALFLLF